MAVESPISWLDNADEAFAKARASKKLVLIDLFNPG